MRDERPAPPGSSIAYSLSADRATSKGFHSGQNDQRVQATLSGLAEGRSDVRRSGASPSPAGPSEPAHRVSADQRPPKPSRTLRGLIKDSLDWPACREGGAASNGPHAQRTSLSAPGSAGRGSWAGQQVAILTCDRRCDQAALLTPATCSIATAPPTYLRPIRPAALAQTECCFQPSAKRLRRKTFDIHLRGGSIKIGFQFRAVLVLL
jgi:hypothetical protein